MENRGDKRDAWCKRGHRTGQGRIKVHVSTTYLAPNVPSMAEGQVGATSAIIGARQLGPFPNHAGFLQTHAHARTTLNGVECCRRMLEGGRLSGARRCIIHDTLLSRGREDVPMLALRFAGVLASLPTEWEGWGAAGRCRGQV